MVFVCSLIVGLLGLMVWAYKKWTSYQWTLCLADKLQKVKQKDMYAYLSWFRRTQLKFCRVFLGRDSKWFKESNDQARAEFMEWVYKREEELKGAK